MRTVLGSFLAVVAILVAGCDETTSPESDGAAPTPAEREAWNAAAGWGDHATAGYLTTELDPQFAASVAAGILATDVANWDEAFAWGDHASTGYLTAETNATLDCTGCVDIAELSFDPATQAELDNIASQGLTSVDGLDGGTITGNVSVAGTLDAALIRQNGNIVCDTSGNCGEAPKFARYQPAAGQSFPGGATTTAAWEVGEASFQTSSFLQENGTLLQPGVAGVYRVTSRLNIGHSAGSGGVAVRLVHSTYGTLDADSMANDLVGKPFLEALIPIDVDESVSISIAPAASATYIFAGPSSVSIERVGAIP